MRWSWPCKRPIRACPTAGWQGTVGAAALVGMFVGGLVFGYLTDLLGRRVMYSADLLVLIVASAAQFWVHGRVSLLVLRFVLGLWLQRHLCRHFRSLRL